MIKPQTTLAESSTAKRYTITAALPYANGFKHIGHMAGVYLPADIYVRYLRSKKTDVVFVCGSDEHGAAITLQALKEKKTPQQIVDTYHPILKDNLETLGVSFDIYARTSDPIHHETSRDFFREFVEKKLLTIQEEEQYFDEQAKLFLADRYIKGTCPVCKKEDAFGDQCESCGTSLSPQQLIHPKSTVSNSTPVLRKTSHYYLPLQHYQSFIEKWMTENAENGWKINVVGQVNSWVNNGLQARAVTRDLDWGVKVKVGDQEKVLYVWFDAPIGYISATKEWAMKHGKDWEKYWKDPDSRIIHFIGKDNIVFHCIIFPVMLHLKGYNLPYQVPANEFMNLEGKKMSTSRNWNVNINDYIHDFQVKENPIMADVLRYYLTQIMPETKDSEFLWKKFQDANNNELVSILGNYVNRVWILTHKLCNGRIPPLHADDISDVDRKFTLLISQKPQEVAKHVDEFRFRDGLSAVMDLVRHANKYLQDKEPWIVQKTLADHPEHQKSIDNTLHFCLQATANISILIHPFLPFVAQKMCKMMKVVDRMLMWENAGSISLLKTGYPLPPPELLLRNIEDEEIEHQIKKLHQDVASLPTEKKTTPPLLSTPKSVASFDDFTKLDLRVGTILHAEKVEKTDKLLCLRVDIGYEQRTIVSGIAHCFTPEELTQQRVVVVANLEPKKIRGIESKGMILLSENQEGKLSFITPHTDANDGDSCR